MRTARKVIKVWPLLFVRKIFISVDESGFQTNLMDANASDYVGSVRYVYYGGFVDLLGLLVVT